MLNETVRCACFPYPCEVKLFLSRIHLFSNLWTVLVLYSSNTLLRWMENKKKTPMVTHLMDARSDSVCNDDSSKELWKVKRERVRITTNSYNRNFEFKDHSLRARFQCLDNNIFWTGQDHFNKTVIKKPISCSMLQLLHITATMNACMILWHYPAFRGLQVI